MGTCASTIAKTNVAAVVLNDCKRLPFTGLESIIYITSKYAYPRLGREIGTTSLSKVKYYILGNVK